MTEGLRCEGYRRYGGAFTFGPVRWEQCKEKAIVMLTILQDGQNQRFPACGICWKECSEHRIMIIEAEPI